MFQAWRLLLLYSVNGFYVFMFIVEKRLNFTIIRPSSISCCQFIKKIGVGRKKSEKKWFFALKLQFLIQWRSEKIMLELIMQVGWALIMHVENENHLEKEIFWNSKNEPSLMGMLTMYCPLATCYFFRRSPALLLLTRTRLDWPCIQPCF